MGFPVKHNMNCKTFFFFHDYFVLQTLSPNYNEGMVRPSYTL